MRKRKPLTKIDRLRRGRAHAVLMVMDEHSLTVKAVAVASETKPNSVYKAIEGKIVAPAVIDFLEWKLGEPFRQVWYGFPDSRFA